MMFVIIRIFIDSQTQNNNSQTQNNNADKTKRWTTHAVYNEYFHLTCCIMLQCDAIAA